MTNFTEYKRTAFFGRSFEELMLCFGYETEQLIGKRVLDCPSGSSSFVAKANALGIQATGVDPMFYRGADALERLARADSEGMYRKLKAKPECFVAKTFESIDESEMSRLGALADYRLRYPTGGYIPASLPGLPFENEQFDVSLCGHLLFIYSGHFDYTFFRDSAFELCRVSKEEVRVHPIVDGSGKRYDRLDELMESLRYAGYEPEVIGVDHEFFRGTNETLVIRVKGGTE